MSLFEVEAVMPSPRRPHCPLEDLSGPALRAEFTIRAQAAAAAVGKSTDQALARLRRNFKLKSLRRPTSTICARRPASSRVG